jgi:hypothetical protein
MCKRLYFSGMNKIIEELNLDRTAQAVGLQQQWILTEVHIITLGGSDVGWLQTKTQDDDRKFYMKRDPNLPLHISN